MGRKGVSKRKPNQAKNRLVSKDNASADNASVGRAAVSQLVKPFNTDQAINSKQPSDMRKNPKKR